MPLKPLVLCNQIVRKHMDQLGYHFTWAIIDSMNFLLPQRRNRVWGIASIKALEVKDISAISSTYREALASMRSNFQFPYEVNFTHPCVSNDPKVGRHARLVEMAQKKSFGLGHVFIDCQPSLSRASDFVGGIPCVMPTHAVYYLQQRRYLETQDFLNAQGLWSSAFKPDVYQEMLEGRTAKGSLGQCLAGNSFSPTVSQAVLLAGLVSCLGPWRALINQNGDVTQRHSQRPGETLRRLRGKRPAPEFDRYIELARANTKKKKRTCKRIRYHRGGKKKRTRDGAKGKCAVATIWQKEQVWGPPVRDSLMLFHTNLRMMTQTRHRVHNSPSPWLTLLTIIHFPSFFVCFLLLSSMATVHCYPVLRMRAFDEQVKAGNRGLPNMLLP